MYYIITIFFLGHPGTWNFLKDVPDNYNFRKFSKYSALNPPVLVLIDKRCSNL